MYVYRVKEFGLYLVDIGKFSFRSLDAEERYTKFYLMGRLCYRLLIDHSVRSIGYET